jgi:hypothetical protein
MADPKGKRPRKARRQPIVVPPEFLLTGDVARFLNVSPVTVRGRNWMLCVSKNQRVLTLTRVPERGREGADDHAGGRRQRSVEFDPTKGK